MISVSASSILLPLLPPPKKKQSPRKSRVIHAGYHLRLIWRCSTTQSHTAFAYFAIFLFFFLFLISKNSKTTWTWQNSLEKRYSDRILHEPSESVSKYVKSCHILLKTVLSPKMKLTLTGPGVGTLSLILLQENVVPYAG